MSFGKIYPSTYAGSMVGSGPIVFAIWPYIVTTARVDHKSEVVLNPDLIAAIIGGTSPAEIQKAIDFLCQPDPRSTTPGYDGCRLIKRGPMTYFVVNLEKYRDPDTRSKEYWTEYRRKRREKGLDLPNVHKCSPEQCEQFNFVHGTDAGTDADAGTEITPNTCVSGGGKKKRFLKPTLDEVKQKASEIGLPEGECESFINYYESNGWRVGKNPMISWPHALGNWLKNWRLRNPGDPNRSNGAGAPPLPDFFEFDGHKWPFSGPGPQRGQFAKDEDGQGCWAGLCDAFRVEKAKWLKQRKM